jgi:hypothetical protein
MNKPVALVAYLVFWAALAGGIIYCVIEAGYPLWVAVVSAYLLFVFLNGSLAYKSRAQRLRLEGKAPPPYLQYLFFPTGIPKLKDEAPRSTHMFVGVVAALTGVFFVFCGVALAFDAEWSRIQRPVLVAAICMVPTSIGAAFLYLAWRLFAFRKRSTNDVA